MRPVLNNASAEAEAAVVLKAAKEIEARAAKRAAEKEKALVKAAKPKPTRKRKAAAAIDAPSEQDDLGSQDEGATTQ